MNCTFRILTAAFPLLCCFHHDAWAAPGPQIKTQAKAAPVREPAFTGATVRDKVRLRLQPDLNAKVIKDLGRGELLLIVGEDNSFYRVKPDLNQKAYVYAKYVKDGKISGDRVNVRLQPDLESPILIQMGSGDPVSVTTSSSDAWLEIAVPDQVVFYVAKEYVEKVGDANYLSRVRKEERELQYQTELASNLGKAELQKPFEEIDLTAARQAFRKALDLSSNKLDKRAHIEQLLQDIEHAYALKRDAYLSSKPRTVAVEPLKTSESASLNLENELKAYYTKINKLDEKLNAASPLAAADVASPQETAHPMAKTFDYWSPIEGAYLVAWAERKGLSQASFNEFYADQLQNSRVLQGVLQPYSGQVKNRPGDFILVSVDTRKPLAYLYSTQVNLDNAIGKLVKVRAASRNNNQFAYPAYFVLSLER